MLRIGGLGGGMFAHKHEIYLFKAGNEQPLGPYKSKIDGNTIFVEDISIPFETGDIVRYTRPNGVIDEYEIIDPRCFDGGMLDHFELKVKRVDQKKTSNRDSFTQKTPSSLNNMTNHIQVHAHGNSRVIINGNDNSINTYNLQSLQAEITKVRKSIIDSNEPDKEDAITALTEIETLAESGSLTEKGFRSLAKALPHIPEVIAFVANVLQIINVATGG